MKVWRGFTLTLWVILMTLTAMFTVSYYSFSSTVLDQNKTKSWLRESTAYDTLRNEVIAPAITDTVNQKVPNNRLIDAALIRQVTADTLPKDEVEKLTEPALDNFYRWLDSKEPELNFPLELAGKQELFYRNLETRLGEKINSLPECQDDPYPPEEALVTYMCLPSYVTAKEATQAVMGSVRTSGVAPDDTTTSDTFALPTADRGTLKQAPTILNMLWSLNWAAIAGFVLLALFVIISRRAVGLIAVGTSMLIAGVVVLVTTPALSSLSFSAPNGIARVASEIVGVLIPKLQAASGQYAMWVGITGLALIGLGILWIKLRRRNHA